MKFNVSYEGGNVDIRDVEIMTDYFLVRAMTTLRLVFWEVFQLICRVFMSISRSFSYFVLLKDINFPLSRYQIR